MILMLLANLVNLKLNKQLHRRLLLKKFSMPVFFLGHTRPIYSQLIWHGKNYISSILHKPRHQTL